MVSDKMMKALNDQINAELYSAYLYWAMSAHCQDVGLTGAAQWLYAQAQEEFVHAKVFFDHILERGGSVELEALEKPPAKWESLLEVFEGAYEHEQYISGRIHSLVRLAREEGEYASEPLLQWFVSEQVEEEAAANDVVQQLRLAGAQGAGLFMIDRQLGTRVPIWALPAGVPGAAAGAGGAA
jgi:ferritin